MYLEITLVLLSAAVLAMVLMIIPLVIYITRFCGGSRRQLKISIKTCPASSKMWTSLAVNLRASSSLSKEGGSDRCLAGQNTILSRSGFRHWGDRPALSPLTTIRLVRTASAW